MLMNIVPCKENGKVITKGLFKDMENLLMSILKMLKKSSLWDIHLPVIGDINLINLILYWNTLRKINLLVVKMQITV